MIRDSIRRDFIEASNHSVVREQAEHMDAPARCSYALAPQGAFSNPLPFVKSFFLILPPGVTVLFAVDKVAAASDPKSRCCKVHNGLSRRIGEPKALSRSHLHPRPIGQAFRSDGGRKGIWRNGVPSAGYSAICPAIGLA